MTMPLAVEWTNLHQILRSLYADMLPLCSDMMGIAKGLAGLGALFFIAYHNYFSLPHYPLNPSMFQMGLSIDFSN